MLSLLLSLSLTAAPPATDPWADALRELAASRPVPTASAIDAVLRRRIHEAGMAEVAAFAKLSSQREWESFRDKRLDALRASLGDVFAPRPPVKLRVRKTLPGKGFAVDLVTFESAPGVVVTAHLYRPSTLPAKMPGVVLVHSHHAPKTEGELQDMGVMYARAGCLVLVPDLFGHGERRVHPFGTAADYPKPYRVSRQDYFHRHDLSLRLDLLGDSLMGWFVRDLMTCVDVLLAEKNIDPSRIAMFGAVAGGGDPCAVTAALDKRITLAAPFNFGGPQPETKYPLPADAARTMSFAGGGSWEMTRNLRNSVRDGFLPYLVVGSLAPRRHVYGHEFSHDADRDPIYSRLKRIRYWYDSPDTLTIAKGTGLLSGKAPEASHCNNIGPIHRRGIHAALAAMGIAVEEPKDTTHRRPASDLRCLPAGERPDMLAVFAKLADERRAKAADAKTAWAKILGPINSETRADGIVGKTQPVGDIATVREWKIAAVSSLVLEPMKKPAKPSVVVAVGQGNAAAVLRHRPKKIRELLLAGKTVVLAELGGTAGFPPGDRGRSSSATSLAASANMLGEPMVGPRVRELRTVVRAIPGFLKVTPADVRLWGVSTSASDATTPVPAELPQPATDEPMGPLVALLTRLYEPTLAGVDADEVPTFRDVVGRKVAGVPYDAVVPGAIAAGDIDGLRKAAR